MADKEREQHDNQPLFERGKAYRLNDGTRRRVLILEVSTKRSKTDEYEFNQHRYKAIHLDGDTVGTRLSIDESALVATTSRKSAKVTAKEIIDWFGPENGSDTGFQSEPPPVLGLPPGTGEPRRGVFVQDGMSTYQIGKLVRDALLDHDTITVSKVKSCNI